MMKTAMINASPKLVIDKNSPSASHALLQLAKRALRKVRIHDTVDYHIKTGQVPMDEIKELLTYEIWIFSFPIYSGGIPAHLMQFMTMIRNLSTAFPEKGTPTGAEQPIRIYAIANGGLYEGREAEVAFEMMEHWCEECGFTWGGGLGVGGGPVFGIAHSVGDRFRVRRSFGHALMLFAHAVAENHPAENFYSSPDIRKGAYVVRMNRIVKLYHKKQNDG